jgi:predicted RNase H-like HicB family nuclease
VKVRAIIKENGSGCIGWLVDLPGIYAEGKTSGQVLEMLQRGAEKLLALDLSIDPQPRCTLIDIPSGGDH